MARADRHANRYRTLVQDHVPERVLAAGCVSAPRSSPTFGGPARGLTDPARGDRDHRDPGGAGGFPPTTWLGVTPTRVYAFEAERGRVGHLIGAWDRVDTTVKKSPRVATTRLSLRFGASGPSIELEARKWGAGNHQLLRYLLDPTRTD